MSLFVQAIVDQNLFFWSYQSPVYLPMDRIFKCTFWVGIFEQIDQMTVTIIDLTINSKTFTITTVIDPYFRHFTFETCYLIGLFCQSFGLEFRLPIYFKK